MYNSRGICTIWEENSPDSLVDLAAQCVLRNPGTLFLNESDSAGSNVVLQEQSLRTEADQPSPLPALKLRSGVHLPTDLCDKLLSTLNDLGLDLDDRIVEAFGSSLTRCRLRRLNLCYSSVTDTALCRLLSKNCLRELDIIGCTYLTPETLEVLNQHSSNLVELNMTGQRDIGYETTGCIFPFSVIDDCSKCTTKSKSPGDCWGTFKTANGNDLAYDGSDMEEEWDEEDTDSMKYAKRGYILNAPALKRLSLRDVVICGSNYFPLLFDSLRNLTHLDLSNCLHREGMSNFDWLPKFFGNEENRLYYLVLHNVPELTEDAIVKNICQLKELRHLDISRFSNQGVANAEYKSPNVVLRAIVQSLPHLSSLDISGTNLAGTGTFEMSDKGYGTNDEVEMPKCDIPGLVSRVNRPLNFLGLYKTAHDACCRAHIPALEISGDATEEQTLVAGRHYLTRPNIMESVLNTLYSIFRVENCRNYKSALDVILMAMDRHPAEKVIQISGSASMYYVVRSNILDKINVKVKRKILSTVLNGMLAHKDDPIMMRNGCLTLCNFQIPQDFYYDYERLIKILLYIVSCHEGGDELNFVLLAGICLLNTVACQVDGKQKLILGDMGAMEKMLELIRFRLNMKTCDNVMENAWSTMWNVTDETPINCQRFLSGGGMRLFLECKDEFPNKETLLRNMMGLLGNVAEVPYLRPKLMTTPFVTEFAKLLGSRLDGIEVSYNAAGVLAHMVSDGAEAWTITEPSREEVVNKMVNAIESWDLKSRRNINYRSFEPILRLVRVSHTPQCQHWAIWALANLTNVDAKYCSLVVKEGGLTLLEELISDNSSNRSYKRVIELATIVRDNVAKWKEQRGIKGSDNHEEESDDVEYIYAAG